jgi:hypothetical protein
MTKTVKSRALSAALVFSLAVCPCASFAQQPPAQLATAENESAKELLPNDAEEGKRIETPLGLREQLAALTARRSAATKLVISLKEAAHYSVPALPQASSGNGSQRKSVSLGLLGLGLAGAGVYLMATPPPPKSFEESINPSRFFTGRRYYLGLAMSSAGIGLAVLGFSRK